MIADSPIVSAQGDRSQTGTGCSTAEEPRIWPRPRRRLPGRPPSVRPRRRPGRLPSVRPRRPAPRRPSGLPSPRSPRETSAWLCQATRNAVKHVSAWRKRYSSVKSSSPRLHAGSSRCTRRTRVSLRACGESRLPDTAREAGSYPALARGTNRPNVCASRDRACCNGARLRRPDKDAVRTTLERPARRATPGLTFWPAQARVVGDWGLAATPCQTGQDARPYRAAGPLAQEDPSSSRRPHARS
jgi:hypothetical protein